MRLDLPSSSRARHRGPRRRALGDHAAGQGVAGAQGMLPSCPARAAMDAPRPQRLRQVHPAEGSSSELRRQHFVFFRSHFIRAGLKIEIRTEFLRLALALSNWFSTFIFCIQQ